ncbi:hypothetical protein BU24DRAFT_417195, partial [Aaosphaeria arxii CBS 175.79]
MTDYHTDFDLRARKKVKQSIKHVGPMVIMPQEESAARTKSGKAYRSPTYFMVEYHSDKRRNPLCKSHPLVEWLTRTELSQFHSVKWVEKRFQEMLPSYNKNKAFFEKCREDGKHPGTKQPLQEGDRCND